MTTKTRDVGLFTLLSFLYSWPIFFIVDAWLVPMFQAQNNLPAARVTLALGHTLGMLGPAIAAILMWRVFSKAPAPAAGAPAASTPAWKWSLPKHYGWVALAMLAFWGLPAVVSLALGDTFESPIEPSMWIMIGTYVIGGWFAGMGEEIGWCAYLLSRLSPEIGKARAMVVSGTIRGLWHWPVLVGSLIAKVIAGEQPFAVLIVASLGAALLLAFSNIFFGAVLNWLWYRTESMPLVGWFHYWHNLVRDTTAIVLVGYGASLWASPWSGNVFMVIGCLLLTQIGRGEGTGWRKLFKPQTAGLGAN